MKKETEILKWSNPIQVRKIVDEYLGKDVPVYLSSRKDKKYMLQDPNGKWIHFGQMEFSDFTQHKDEARRARFLNRNKRWSKQDTYTAGWLSYHILW